MINPFIDIPQDILQPGEIILPLNQYTLEGCIIKPFYYVSNLGRYFSIATDKFVEKVPFKNSGGYLEHHLQTNKGQKHVLAHRGVMSTFCPRPDMYQLQVDHIHGIKDDNRLSELRWTINTVEQMQHAKENGLLSPRSRNITNEIIIQIMNLAKSGYSDEEISNAITEIKIAKETVRFIRTGQAIYGQILKELGLEPIFRKEHNNMSIEEYNKIDELFKSGKTINEISYEMRIPSSTIRHIIIRWYGTTDQRKDLNSLEKQKSDNSTILVNPFITPPKDNKYEGIIIYPVNIYTSNLHVIVPYYGVSKDGRVFSFARGNKWIELKPYINDKGYGHVKLLTNHDMKQFFVHRLIMSTFCPRPDMYNLEVDHKNGVHNDNRLENLDWVTHDENMKRAGESGSIVKIRVSQRVPDEDIIQIINLAWAGNSDEKISELMNHKYTAHNIRIIRSGLKTYGPVLEQLGLKPFKYHKGSIDKEIKLAVVKYIDSIKDSIGMMESYKKAGEEFDIHQDTIRSIYREYRT